MRRVDVVIVGGGPAGLSAALCLGRSRKRAVVFDAGAARHSVADGVHNFLTREGVAPAELRRIAWEQMSPYGTIEGPVERRIIDAERVEDGWVVADHAGDKLHCRALIIATGVIDEHPDIPGYAERWGDSIHQCPFCHGWEVQDEPVAVLADPDHAMQMAPMLRGWTNDVAVLTNGEPFTAEQRNTFEELGMPACDKPIAELRGEGGALEEIVLANGSTIRRTALFSVTPQRQVPLVAQLGLELNEAGYVVIDEQMQTSVPGIYAAGDVTSRMQQVVQSAAQGLCAGAMITATMNMSASA